MNGIAESTMLLRQVNPNWVQNGRVTSLAFFPFPKDEMKLSVYNGSMIEPEASWVHFTAILSLQSQGVLGVTVGECNAQSLPALADPAPYPEHTIIDFQGNSKSQIKTKSAILRDVATSRSWLFQRS